MGIITTNAPSAAVGPRRFLARLKPANIPAGYRCRNLRRRNGYDSRQSCLEPDSIERPSPDAPRASLARPALVSYSDDFDDAHGRRLALVFARRHLARLRRRAPLPRHRRSRLRRADGNFGFPGSEENQQASASLRNRAALLVLDSSPRQIFVSVRPHHHSLRYRPLARPLLPATPRGPTSRRASHRLLPHNPRHALPKRRPGRLHHRNRARHTELPRIHNNPLNRCDTNGGASPPKPSPPSQNPPAASA